MQIFGTVRYLLYRAGVPNQKDADADRTIAASGDWVPQFWSNYAYVQMPPEQKVSYESAQPRQSAYSVGLWSETSGSIDGSS